LPRPVGDAETAHADLAALQPRNLHEPPILPQHRFLEDRHRLGGAAGPRKARGTLQSFAPQMLGERPLVREPPHRRGGARRVEARGACASITGSDVVSYTDGITKAVAAL